MSGHEDAEEKRNYQAPYSANHPIPTISKYRKEKAARQQNALDDTPERDESTEQTNEPQDLSQPTNEGGSLQDGQGPHDGAQDGAAEDTSQVVDSAANPKQKLKDMKNRDRERAEREVTDPITHLPVSIHDFTDKALKQVEINDKPFGQTTKTATGLSGSSKSSEQLQTEKVDEQKTHDILANRFPPPDFDALRQELALISKRGITIGLTASSLVLGAAVFLVQILQNRKVLDDVLGDYAQHSRGAIWLVALLGSAAAVWVIILGVRDWVSNKSNNVFQDELWDAQRRQIESEASKHQTETTAWLNSLLSSVWPIINPDLFTSLADTLEDVMQASLPKFIRMISVDDIGQGSEALRILGVRWLPTGAATESVTKNGSLSSEGDLTKSSQNDNKDKEEKSTDGQTVAAGMEAEEGDFINLEVAFAYRTRSSSKTLKERTKDMHLYLAFYLIGNVKLPVWVDLHGIIGTMRLRLQLTPDPPFFALCTLTFLGQPKVNLSCVPLNKHGLNIMDLPFISNFVQSAVDAAMSEYVAPKSLTLDLKDMLAGDDFKKDTTAVGVLMVNIKRGYDFKVGDSGIPLIKDGSSDPYVSVGWAKFGKVIWSTRILVNEMEPRWDETCFILVTPEELNVDERLRVQLWDSDRLTADDDLGRIEVDLKEIMRSQESNGNMWNREDSFRALKSGDNMPGRLEWSVGYYSKTRLQKCQFEQQDYDTEIRTMKQLEDKVARSCESKLRETMFKEGRNHHDESELKQQKAQELKAEQDAMIISAPPPEGYPSGLFSIQIHNITGLELQKTGKSGDDKDADDVEESEAGDGLPSSYCTIIINHRKTFKTRTKPQNSKPFFNAGCERFIRDWRDCEVYVAVRDARLHEDDPLLGIIHLPLNEIFEKRAQVMGTWPISGGVGHGKIRLSMVWRSVQLQAPKNLLGWDYGTVEIQQAITSDDCSEELRSVKMKVKTNISAGKLYPNQDKKGWEGKGDDNMLLAVNNRYNSCLTATFKDKGLLGDEIAAFAVLWLKDVPDEEEQELELPIWKGDFKRATTSCLENCGEKVGTLKMKMTFWSGLGNAHSAWASRNASLRSVVEVIDTARDNVLEDKMQKKAGIVDEEFSSDSSDSELEELREDIMGGGKGKKDIPDGSKGQQQGPVDQIRDYKRRDKALHRQHRGLMQWKAPRTAKWVKHKLGSVGDDISEVFDHRSKGQPALETEV